MQEPKPIPTSPIRVVVLALTLLALVAVPAIVYFSILYFRAESREEAGRLGGHFGRSLALAMWTGAVVGSCAAVSIGSARVIRGVTLRGSATPALWLGVVFYVGAFAVEFMNLERMHPVIAVAEFAAIGLALLLVATAAGMGILRIARRALRRE